MSESKPRIGVIGAGYWGKNLLRNFEALGVLHAFCDADATARATFGERYPRANAHSDAAELLADPAIDAVAIATPTATHGMLARQALEAGKHVFVEKPICLDVDDAANLNALADRLDRTLMVGHLLLYHPAFEALQAAVRGGQLGEIRYIYSNRASLGKIRREENALWSFAPHDVSMILRLTGSMPERVMCGGSGWLHPMVADTSLTHLVFPGNLQGHIFVSWIHPFKDHKLVVVGSDGMAVFDDVQPGEGKLLHYRHTIGWENDLPTVDKAEAVPIPYSSDEPLARECSHFIDCVMTGRRPLSDGHEGWRVLSVLEACQKALDTGTVVHLDKVGKVA